MRLIDADALKKAFEDTVCIEPMPYAFVKQIIDNAPTVFSCNACKNMGNERECVDCYDYSNYVHYEERQQGEWINQEHGTFYPIECSKCHNQPFFNDEGYVLSNFCPSCGAKMEK